MGFDELISCCVCSETWEEIGLDLADKEYLSVGRLDDREITTSLGKRLLMILSPFGESDRTVWRYRNFLLVIARSILADITNIASSRFATCKLVLAIPAKQP